MRVLRDVLFFEPQRTGTDMDAALDYLNRVHRRRTIVFLFSDFLHDGTVDSFRRAAQQHDLIAVRTTDPREQDWPSVGLLRIEDAETGRQAVIDTSNPRFQTAFAARSKVRREAFTNLVRSAQVDLIEVSTDGNHFDALLRFFQLRDRRRRGG